MRVQVSAPTGTVLAAAFAALAALSGLDRIAADNSGLPVMTDWAYARNAPYKDALAAATGNHWALSEALISRAIAADPVNEHLIGGLGQLRLARGNPGGADTAFRVSAQRGWRDPATHLYWMKQSIAAADFTTAALHADALLRMPLGDAAHDQILVMLLEYDEGRTALAMRLRNHPNWAHEFAVSIDTVSDDALMARADVIGRAGPGIWTCDETSGLINWLITHGSSREARTVHVRSCAQSAGRSDNIVNDTHFVRLLADGPASGLDWVAPDNSDVAIGPAKGGTSSTGVQVTTSRGVTLRVLAQRVFAERGTYRLTWRMPDTDAASARALVATMGCNADLGAALAGTVVPGRPDTYQADIPFAGNCAAPAVAFWLRPSAKSVTLDDVTLINRGK